MNDQQTVEEKVTAADIKRQINEAKEAMKDSGMPITGQLANEINASAESIPEVTNSKAEVKPEPVKAAEKVEALSAEDADLMEWAKKKGVAKWETDLTVLKALRKSDQDYGKWKAEEKAKGGEVRSYPPPQPQAAYNPPAPPVMPVIQNRQTLEHLAKQYDVPPDDFVKIMKINQDFYEVASRGDRDRQQAEFESIRREQQKQAVLHELSSDPVLKNPEIAAEFQRLIQEKQSIDPNSFEKDPTAYIDAREKALNNYARRNLEGRILQEGVTPQARMVMPTTPPRPLGRGSGGGAEVNESEISPDQFAKLTLAEKAYTLKKMGLRPAY